MLDLKTFPNDAKLGAYAAELILERLLRRRDARGPMTLGCPSGRSPRSTYAALGRIAAAHGLDLSSLHLIMMDEFVIPSAGRWELCPSDAHYSCRRFGEVEIRRVLNAGLGAAHRVPSDHLHLPDPNAPEAYERLIDQLGGVDLFVLASGATDGHVAFNPPGTPADALTRVVRLSEATRHDNLASFPQFGVVDAVPLWGVSVGPATIVRASCSAMLILSGRSKAEAFRRITGATGYQPGWPATVVHACADAVLLADATAAPDLAEAGSGISP
jgi:glucosamine-6-phosphate deaminase